MWGPNPNRILSRSLTHTLSRWWVTCSRESCRSIHGRGIEDADALERPERLESSGRRRVDVECQVDQRGSHARGTTLHEETLRGVANDAVVVDSKDLHQFRVAHRGEVPLPDARRRVLVDDAPDATETDGSRETTFLDLLAKPGGHVDPMLHDATSEVDDVETTVGSGDQVHRTEPFIGGGEELLLVVGGRGDRNPIAVLESIPLHEVARGLADEGVTLGAVEQRPSEDLGSTGRGEGPERSVRPKGRVLVAAIDTGILPDRPGRTIGGDAARNPGKTAGLGIAGGVVLRPGVADQRIAVRGVEEPAEVVASDTPLTVSGIATRLDLEASVVSPTNPKRLAVLRGLVPVVDSVAKSVARVFRVLDSTEARDQDLRLVGPAVSIGVAAVNEIRRLDHEKTVERRGDGPGQHEVLEEDLVLVHGAVAIGVAQPDDATDRYLLALAVGVRHVAAHLADPEITRGVEDRLDRIADQRFARDELDPESGLDPKGLEGLWRIQRGRGGKSPLLRHLPLHFAGAVAVLGERRAGRTQHGQRVNSRDTDDSDLAGHAPSLWTSEPDPAPDSIGILDDMTRLLPSSSIPMAAMLGLVLAASTSARGDDEETAGPWWTQLETRPLFPGTFGDDGLPTGWSVIGGPATYAFEKGPDGDVVVNGTGGAARNAFLVDPKVTGDFLLELDVRLARNQGNSGIQIRSTVEESRDRMFGYQIEVDPSARAWSGGLYDEGRRGWLASLADNLDAREAFVPGEWNRYRILAVGPRIRTWINGVPGVDHIDFVDPAGRIGLQIHSGRCDVSWRHLRIADLGVRRPTPLLAPGFKDGVTIQPTQGLDEIDEGWRLALDGVVVEGRDPWPAGSSGLLVRTTLERGALRLALGDPDRGPAFLATIPAPLGGPDGPAVIRAWRWNDRMVLFVDDVPLVPGPRPIEGPLRFRLEADPDSIGVLHSIEFIAPTDAEIAAITHETERSTTDSEPVEDS